MGGSIFGNILNFISGNKRIALHAAGLSITFAFAAAGFNQEVSAVFKKMDIGSDKALIKEEKQKLTSKIAKPADKKVPTPTEILTPTPTIIPTRTYIVRKETESTQASTIIAVISPTPVLQPSLITSSTELDSFFDKYSSEYNVDKNLLIRIARCESGINTNAVNGPYGGIFQFSSSTWVSTRTRMGYDTDSSLRFNPEESIRTAAFKISVDGSGSWPNC